MDKQAISIGKSSELFIDNIRMTRSENTEKTYLSILCANNADNLQPGPISLGPCSHQRPSRILPGYRLPLKPLLHPRSCPHVPFPTSASFHRGSQKMLMAAPVQPEKQSQHQLTQGEEVCG